MAGSTFLELLTEFYARGLNDLNDGGVGEVRAKRWINLAYAKVCLEERWPFRLTTATGAAPLTIADLDQVHSVTATSSNNLELIEATEQELVAGLTATGSVPTHYYIDGTVIRTWPVTTGTTLQVRYWKVPAELSASGDVTLIDKRYTDLVVDDAVRRASKSQFSQEDVALMAQEYGDGLDLMRRQLLIAPDHVRRVAWHEDD